MTTRVTKVWVIVSDCGLNGPWIHDIYLKQPHEATVAACAAQAGRTTGYQSTYVEEFELDDGFELDEEPW